MTKNTQSNTALTTIKRGFFLGIGFIIPLIFAFFIVALYVNYQTEKRLNAFNQTFSANTPSNVVSITPPVAESSPKKEPSDNTKNNTNHTEATHSTTSDESDSFEDYMRSYTDEITLTHDQPLNLFKQLIITGKLTNNSNVTVNTVVLEAELFKNDKFVYECSKYINNPLKSGDSEYFMIKCGCSKTPIPDFDRAVVTVKKAAKY